MAERIENVEDYSLEDLKKKAERAGVSKSGSKQEIADRINEQSTSQGAEGKDASGTKGVDTGNVDREEQDRLAGRDEDAPQAPASSDDEPEGAAEDGSVETADVVTVDELVDEGYRAPFNYPAAAGPVDEGIVREEGSKQRETEGKEASVPASDPRRSVYDVAPGKSLVEVQSKRAAELQSEYRETVHQRGVQYYVAQEDDRSLIDVAMKLGISDHSKLTAINGIYNGRIELQPGQKVLLPNDYFFQEIDNIETVDPYEGEFVAARLAPEEYDNRTDGERLIPEEEQAKLR